MYTLKYIHGCRVPREQRGIVYDVNTTRSPNGLYMNFINLKVFLVQMSEPTITDSRFDLGNISHQNDHTTL